MIPKESSGMLLRPASIVVSGFYRRCCALFRPLSAGWSNVLGADPEKDLIVSRYLK